MKSVWPGDARKEIRRYCDLVVHSTRNICLCEQQRTKTKTKTKKKQNNDDDKTRTENTRKFVIGFSNIH